MATNMGRGIIAPENTDNISATGVAEMRTMGATTAAAISDLATLSLPRSEAIQYGIPGEKGDQGDRGPRGERGLPGINAVPADEAVAAYISTESQTQAAADTRYTRLDAMPVSVKEYGAIGDGVADDTTAIQNALNEAPRGTTVSLPPGTYRIGTVEVPDGVHLIGYGSTIMAKPDSSERTLILAGDQSAASQLRFNGASADQTVSRQNLITIEGEGCSTSHLWMEDAYDRCIVVEPSARYTSIGHTILARNGVLPNCNGIMIQAPYVTVSGAHIFGHGNGHAIRVGHTEQDPPEYININAVTVHNGQHNAFTLETGSAHVTISGCIAREVPQAVKGDGTAHHITVTDSHFESIELGTAFNLNHVSHSIITGNTLKNSGGGIMVGDHSIVTGNTVEEIHAGAAAGIYGRNDTIITGNQVINTGKVTDGIFAFSGTVTNNLVKNVPSQPIRVQTGDVRGNTIIESGDNTTRSMIQLGLPTVPGAAVTDNIIRSPQNGAHVHSAMVYLLASKGVVRGNVLEGDVPAGFIGVDIIDGQDHHIVTENILSPAATPVRGGTGENNVIMNNL